MAVSIGLAQQFQPKIDRLQADLIAEGQAGKKLTTDSATFKQLEKFNGDLMNNTITYYRDANPFGLTQDQLMTMSTSQKEIGQELTRVKQNGAVSPERILGALDSIEAIMPSTKMPVTEPSSSTGAISSGEVSGKSTSNVQSTSDATVSELLDAVKSAETSNDKYTLIKEAIGKMREGGESAAPVGDQPKIEKAPTEAKTDGGGKVEGGGEAESTKKAGAAEGGKSTGAPIDSAAFDKLLTALGDLADAVQGMVGLSEQAKSQIFDKIADILKVIDGLQASAMENSSKNSQASIDPALLNALNTLNEQVQTSLPEGATKKAVQDLIADILKTLVESGGGSALAGQLNAVLAGAKGTGSQALIDKVNELTSIVSSSAQTSGK